MTVENIDYAVMVADMKAKRSTLDALISALEAALASGALGQVTGEFSPCAEDGSGLVGSIAMELPVGAFLGKSLRAAIKLLLATTKKKLTTAEVVAALKEGGAESTSAKFESVVAATLNHLKLKGEVLRFKDGWALAEHYSESLRKRLSEGQKPTKNKNTHRRVKARKKKSTPSAPKMKELNPPQKQGDQAA